MSKFWTVVTLLLVLGLVLIAVDRVSAPGVNFSDLETECRYDTGNSTNIGVEHKRVTFSGRFTTPSPNTDLSYRYSISDSKNIELNIVTEESIIPDSFVDSCLASVVYDASTDRLEEGNYTVNLYHNGDRQEEVGIRIK